LRNRFINHEAVNLKNNEMWENIRKNKLVNDIANEKKVITNSDLPSLNEFIHSNKSTII
jgi:hypothetical protein